MRVIAGSARGTRLVAVPEGTRPLSDRAREGLFSSIAQAVPGAMVLDLFAGTGAVGIEALSRGAASATFVDRSPEAIRAIRANLDKTHLADRADVVKSEVVTYLEQSSQPVDLVFLDPPYDTPSQQIEQTLALAAAHGLRPAGTLVLTRPRRSSTHVIPVHFALARRLSYGDSLVLVYREV
jgi:16S rRNA (guanine966-N2)-methyltransferase